MRAEFRRVAGTARWLPRALLLLAALAGPVHAHAQPVIRSVTPSFLELQQGGAAQVARVSVENLTDVTRVRVMQGRLEISGFRAAATRTSLTTTRAGAVASFDVSLSAASTVPAGTYAVQLLSSAGVATLPLELKVVAPALRTGTVLTQPTTDLQSRLPPPRLLLTVGCSGSGVAPQSGQTTNLGEINFPGTAGPLVIEVCATEGFAEYRWTLEGISHEPYPGEAYSTVTGSGAQVAPNRFVITIPSPKKRQRVRLLMEARPAVSSFPAQGGRLWFSPVLPNFVEVARPALEKYWVDNIRPGASGRLENGGIYDPDLTGDPADGVFWLQGTNLNAPGLRVWMSASPSREATILERSRAGGSDIIKARLSGFTAGRLRADHSGGSASLSRIVPRLGYWAFPVPDLNALLQGVSCSLGSPRGRATLVLPNGTQNYILPAIEGLGFKVDILDLNSSAVTIRAEQGGQTGREVVLTTQIDFETSGREFSGTFLPTITWWECGTFRVETARCATLDLACFGQVIGSALASSLSCMSPTSWQQRTGPGPAVPVSGDLIAPRATFRTTLGIDNVSGQLVPRSIDASFTADITLQTGAGTVPLGPLKTLVLQRTNADLKKLAGDAGFDVEIARLVNGIAQNFGVRKLQFVQRTADGRIYMEYER